MRPRSTAVRLATFGLVITASSVLTGTILTGTALAGTPTAGSTTPAAGATCTNGATRGTTKPGTYQKCQNGTWVDVKCPASKPVVQYYAGPPPYYMCTPGGGVR